MRSLFVDLKHCWNRRVANSYLFIWSRVNKQMCLISTANESNLLHFLTDPREHCYKNLQETLHPGLDGLLPQRLEATYTLQKLI